MCIPSHHLTFQRPQQKAFIQSQSTELEEVRMDEWHEPKESYIYVLGPHFEVWNPDSNIYPYSQKEFSCVHRSFRDPYITFPCIDFWRWVPIHIWGMKEINLKTLDTGFCPKPITGFRQYQLIRSMNKKMPMWKVLGLAEKPTLCRPWVLSGLEQASLQRQLEEKCIPEANNIRTIIKVLQHRKCFRSRLQRMGTLCILSKTC